jgi:hypothetical protein
MEFATMMRSVITAAVRVRFPDISLDDFWANAVQAQDETLSTLLDLAERLEWQIVRAAELASLSKTERGIVL